MPRDDAHLLDILKAARLAIDFKGPVDGAIRTIAGYEAMNMIRKGQVRWLPKGDIVGQMRFVEQVFGIAA